MTEMVALATYEARRIELVQENLVEAGLRAAASPDELRRMRVYEAIVHMIEVLRGDRVIMDRIARHFGGQAARAKGSAP